MNERRTPETVYWTDGLHFNHDRQAVGVKQTTNLCRPCDLYRVLADGIVACPECEQELLLPHRRSKDPSSSTAPAGARR